MLACMFAGCGSGGGNATSPLPGTDAGGTGSTLAPQSLGAATVSATATATPAGFAITGYGGYKGTVWAAHVDGDTYDYPEVVTIDFTQSPNQPSFNANFSIAPSAPWGSYFINYGKRAEITFRKTPGVKYTLTLKSGTLSTTGTALAGTAVFHLTTPATVSIPAPTAKNSNDHYRYGFGATLSGSSLGGSNMNLLAGLMEEVGTGFVRIDFAPEEIMPTSTTFDWTQSDAIVASLKEHGVDVLPLLEQYSTAAWQNDGQAYPAIFSSPELYAQYVGAVVAHLKTLDRSISRVELFNEPNLVGWWDSPNPAYANVSGAAAAAYMLAGYAAAKAANPKITVVGPGLSVGGVATDPRTFLTNMYAAGCRTGTCWDVLSIHNYSWNDPTYTIASSYANRYDVYQDLQAIAIAHGDPKPHVMFTEWGYSTSDTDEYGFDPQVVAKYMAEGFNLMLADPTIDGICWTDFYATGTDFWSQTAVLAPSYALTQPARTFQAFAHP